MRPYVLVAGDFVRTGGMDVANLALAAYLARRGTETHVVAHRVDPALAALPGVTVHAVPRPLRSHLLGAQLLERAGRRWLARLAPRGVRGVVNGGNCPADGVATWLHYVHAAHAPRLAARGAAGLVRRALAPAVRRGDLAAEREAVRRARLVIANSERTRRDAIERLGAPPERVRTVYYGVDAARFRPPSPEERAAARAALDWPPAAPVVVFVGALGDRRKGFDVLFEAWRALCADPGWPARLAVVGAGRELEAWRARAERAGLGDHVRFVGFTRDVRAVLWASSAVVAPSRYEAYGLAVHEALCCGLPAVVSRDAGVAERLDGAGPLRDLVIGDPESPAELAGRLRAWLAGAGGYAAAAAELSAVLRRRGWDDMAAEIAGLLEERGDEGTSGVGRSSC